jgi:uncharacterized protein (DUF433 family)
MSEWQKRITVDPEIMVGKPVIRGTRIPVELIVRMLGQGISEEEILADYPRLQSEDIRAALTYATKTFEHCRAALPHKRDKNINCEGW